MADRTLAMTAQSAGVWWRPRASEIAAGALPEPGSRLAFVALVAFTAILLLSPQTWIPALEKARLAFVAAAIAFAAFLVDRAAQRRPATPLVPREVRLALLLAGWAIVTVPLSYWPSGSLNVLTDHYLKAVAFFWLIGALITTRSRVRVFAWVMVLCSVPLALSGLRHYWSGRYATLADAPIQRIVGYVGGSGIAENPNDLALLLNLTIPISGALLLTSERRLARLAAFATLVSSVAGVIVTFSRAGFLTLAVIFLMSIVVLVRRRLPGAAAALVVGALLVPPFLPAEYVARLSTITEISADRTGSAQGRWADLLAATAIVQDHPLAGVGIGQDILALNERRGATWRSVHNVYLQYAVDLGLPGLFLFVWLLFESFRSARRSEHVASRLPDGDRLAGIAAGVRVSLMAFAVAAFFHPVAYQFYFFFVAGLAVALRNACRTELGRTALAPS